MPVLDGIEATRRISADKQLDGVHVVMLTNYGLDEYVYDALRAGASGFPDDPALLDLHAEVRDALGDTRRLRPPTTSRVICPQFRMDGTLVRTITVAARHRRRRGAGQDGDTAVSGPLAGAVRAFLAGNTCSDVPRRGSFVCCER